MTHEAHLSLAPAAAPVRGVALVLHGGRSQSTAAVRSRQLAVLRMLPFARALARAGARDGLAVARLRFAVRGWNGELRSPVADVEHALDELARRYPGVPCVLVGHSMGGRAALYAAGYPSVAGVVALAPWLERGDPVAQLAGRRVLIAHGTLDRTTSARGSADYAAAARAAGATVTYVGVSAESHAMLRRAVVWHRLATGYVMGVLFGVRPGGRSRDPASSAVTAALAGEGSLVV
jgi:alpha-beta hydrolase superfamily lysophospholipase